MIGVLNEIHEEEIDKKDAEIKKLKTDLKWALELAKSRKLTRDYTKEDEKIIKLLGKYNFD